MFLLLKKQLDDTNARLQRIEQEGNSAQKLIRDDVQSCCLLHNLGRSLNQANGTVAATPVWIRKISLSRIVTAIRRSLPGVADPEVKVD